MDIHIAKKMLKTSVLSTKSSHPQPNFQEEYFPLSYTGPFPLGHVYAFVEILSLKKGCFNVLEMKYFPSLLFRRQRNGAAG